MAPLFPQKEQADRLEELLAAYRIGTFGTDGDLIYLETITASGKRVQIMNVDGKTYDPWDSAGIQPLGIGILETVAETVAWLNSN